MPSQRTAPSVDYSQPGMYPPTGKHLEAINREKRPFDLFVRIVKARTKSQGSWEKEINRSEVHRVETWTVHTLKVRSTTSNEVKSSSPLFWEVSPLEMDLEFADPTKVRSCESQRMSPVIVLRSDTTCRFAPCCLANSDVDNTISHATRYARCSST